MPHLLHSWTELADQWISIIQSQGIRSRLTTDQAIVDIIKSYNPKKLVDIGCGEGSLVRTLRKHGIEINGIDGVPKFIEYANKFEQGAFYQLSFEELINTPEVPGGAYDAALLNFCLFEDQLTVDLINALREKLEADRLLFLQTLHPTFVFKPGLIYENQWISDSWKGISEKFEKSYEWYARTLQGWFEVFKICRVDVENIHEVCVDKQEGPFSIIFVLKAI